ncbi:hypothetical protein BRADI_1g53811v3 [Brachypodium distachyon]|uniref:PDZ domain-containing protein n=1 Tax=Brachypodium distachyon TaxID=15368 RepID=A0A2K2DRA1_BRADI|nr:hypothetical protein BRADI_1g53811v3 [Brachypodium distachyon]
MNARGLYAGAPPPAKKRNIDPIVPTNHPWNLPATISLVDFCGRPEDSAMVIPREANLPIDAEAREAVARVSQAVVGVADVDGSGDQWRSASGFIFEFNEYSMIGKILSSPAIAKSNDGMIPKIEKVVEWIRHTLLIFMVLVVDKTCDDHWNLLVLSVSFDCAVQTLNMVEIRENMESRLPRDDYLGGLILQPHSALAAHEMLCPGDTIIGLGRQSEEPFGLQANCGIYRFERWASFPTFCHEMQKATFINTYAAIGGPAINKQGKVIGMLFHDLDYTPFMPCNIILKWWEHFKETGKYCRPTIGVFGVNLHNAHSSRWVKVPTALYEGLDGFLVELTSLAVRSVGLQQKDLIIKCNGEHLFEILSGNIGKMVKVTFKAEDRETHSVFLPVEETLEKKFYRYM